MDIDDLPPEILATAFEIGILSSGIKFLFPICLVCRNWNNIVASTPRLWGIISITKASQIKPLNSQITKAKASPLTIYIRENGLKCQTTAEVKRAISRVVLLAGNWSSADVATSVLCRCKWSEMYRTLEELTLCQGGRPLNPMGNFVDGDSAQTLVPPRLHTFTADRLDDNWVTPFLSSSIRFFKYFRKGVPLPLIDTLHQLSKISLVRELKYKRLHHMPRLPTKNQVISLLQLRTLELTSLAYPALLLSSLSAPALQTLVIDRVNTFSPWGAHNIGHINPDFIPLAPFFSQWCDSQFLPSHLHTLKLVDCLSVNDIPFLIRFLSRLSNLIRLILIDDRINQSVESTTQTPENNIFTALAHSEGASSGSGGWLCPSLMVLHMEANFEIKDLIQIALHRGVRSNTISSNVPKRLRILKGFICGNGDDSERTQLESLVENVECSCLGCTLVPFNL